MNCTKTSERINFLLFTMSICNIYEQQRVHVRYHYYLIHFNFFLVFSQLTSLSLKDKYMDCLYIVSITDMGRCERLHLEIIVCIPCVYVRIYVIHPLHPLNILCFRNASALKLLPITLFYPLSTAKLQIIPSTYYPCSFFFHFVF